MSTLAFVCGFDAGRAVEAATGSYQYLQENSTGVAGTITYDGVNGNYHFVGGAMTGSRNIGENAAAANPWAALESWYQCRLKFASFPNSGLSQNIMAISCTDGVTAYTGQKAQVWILSSGKAQLKMEQAPNTTQDGAVALSLNTEYIFSLHSLNGTNVTQELRIYDAVTGVLIDLIQLVITNTGGADLNGRITLGLRQGVDCTGLDFTGDDMIVFTGAGDPGPCRVKIKIPVTVASAGGWTAVGAVDIALALKELGGNDGDTTRAQNDITVTTVNTCILNLQVLGLTAASFKGVSCNVLWRAASGTPTLHIGVQVGSSIDVSTVGAVNTAYRPRQQIKTINPQTSLPWVVSDIDTIQGVLRDADAVTTAFVVTQAFWEIVYEVLVSGGGGAGSGQRTLLGVGP